MRIIASVIASLLFAGAALAQDATQTPPPPNQTPPAAPPTSILVPTGPQATIETSAGTIVIALDPAHAPATVANFIKYARDKHFDGTVFYRILPGSLIQAGSYNADGSFHGKLRKPIVFEGGQHNLRGSIAMAHGDDPNSATAEFFIETRDLPTLDPAPGNTGFAVFGQVTSGMDVVDQISKAQLGGKGPFPPDATPVSPMTIEKVTISGG
jgi:peptidyl-prolyl cis-trans isomerase A (cyclophilin A)